MDVVEKNEYRGYIVNIFHDPTPESPDTWDYPMGTIYSNHRKYNPSGHKMEEIIEFDEGGAIHVIEDYIYVKISFYEHGGISLSAIDANEPCPKGWDCGLFGLMAVSKERVIKEFGDLSDESIQGAICDLKQKVELWDQYCNGRVYAYTIEDPEGEIIDSCFGFYGEYDCNGSDLMDYAKDAIDSEIDSRNKEAERVLKMEGIIDPFYID